MNRRTLLTDPWVPLFAGLLTLAGLFFAIDAGYARSMHGGHGSIPPEFGSQVVGWIVGLAAAWGASRLNVGHLKRWAVPFGVIVYILLLLTAFSPLAVIKSGAERWVHFGPLVLQPAELAKIAAILFMAAWFAKRRPLSPPKKKPQDVFAWLDCVAVPRLMRWLPVLAVLPAVYLIEREPDMGTAAVIVAVCFAMAAFGGAKWQSIVAAAAVGCVAASIFVAAHPYRLARITSHGSQWASENVDGPGYQQLQAKVSMARGGIIGVGVGEGRAKHVIPAPTTDFIMATVAEELGFLGCITLLGLLGVICWRLITLARTTPNDFAALFLIGLAAWLAIQGCTNLMQANDTLPAIGIPFPFVSSGGSSLAALWLAVGLAQAALRPAPKLSEEAVVDDSLHRGRDRRSHLSRA